MRLSELIQHVGDEHVQFQVLSQDLVRAHQGKNATIEFATDPKHVLEIATASLTGDKPSHIGFIVWLPRERCPQEVADKL